MKAWLRPLLILTESAKKQIWEITLNIVSYISINGKIKAH